MRRQSALILLLLSLTASLWGSERDIIVMVDISASMDPYFKDLTNYFTQDLLRQTRIGDTFHFLSFSATAEIEVSEAIRDQGSFEKIIRKILMLQPFGLYTDLVAAVKFLTDFTTSLPPDSEKIILLLTDGIHDPPPSSPHRIDSDSVLENLLGSAEKISRAGWMVHILQMPSEEQPAGMANTKDSDGKGSVGKVPGSTERGTDTERTEERAYLADLATALGVDVLLYSQKESFSKIEESIKEGSGSSFSVAFPGHLGTVSSPFHAPLSITNNGNTEIQLKLVLVEHKGENILSGETAIAVPGGRKIPMDARIALSKKFPEGSHSIEVSLSIDDGRRSRSFNGVLSFTFSHTPILSLGKTIAIPLNQLLLVLVIIALALILLVFFLKKRQSSQVDKTLRPSGGGFKIFRSGEEIIEMRVVFQNPRIGARNMHSIRRGKRLTVGGGRSNFLIFILPFPPHIAEIRYDGEDIAFRPIKREFFPEIKESIESCLGKEIPVQSKRGYPLVIRFQRYVSPLAEINRILQSPLQGSR